MTTTIYNSLNAKIENIKSTAEKWKPAGFDADHVRRETHLRGDIKPLLKDHLVKAFPVTHASVESSLLPLPLQRSKSSQLMSFYDVEPERKLVTSTGEDASDALSQALKDLVARSQINDIASDIELDVCTSMTVIIVARVKKTVDDDGNIIDAIQFDRYPPTDVWIVPDEKSPGEIQLSKYVLLRGYNDKRQHEHELWTRGEDGKYTVDVIDADGNLKSTSVSGASRIPFVRVSRHKPTKGVYMETSPNDLDVIEAMITTYSDEHHAMRKAIHEPMVLYSMNAAAKIETGPDVVTQLHSANDRLETIASNPKLAELRTFNRETMKTSALLDGLPPHAFSIEAGAPESGFARQIAEQELTSQKEALASVFVEFERDLWAIALELSDEWLSGVKFAGHRVVTTQRSKKGVEDAVSLQSQLIEAIDAGLITKAFAASRLGYYPSVDEAEKAGVPNDFMSTIESSLPPISDVSNNDEVKTTEDNAATQATANATTVSDTAFTGIQIDKGIELAQRVRDGMLDSSTAEILFQAFFPAVPEAIRKKIFETIDVVKKETVNVTP